MEPRFYKINTEVLNKITKYLGSKPYVEVFKLIEELQDNLELLPLEKENVQSIEKECEK